MSLLCASLFTLFKRAIVIATKLLIIKNGCFKAAHRCNDAVEHYFILKNFKITPS